MEDDTGDMRNSLTPIIMVFVGMIIVTGLLIPFLLDLTQEDPYCVGDAVSYSPTTNIPGAVYSYGGSLLDNSEYTTDGNGTILIRFTDAGTYTFEVYAETQNPHQTAVQTYDVHVGERGQYHDYKPLLLVIPVLLFVGMIVFILGRRISGGGSGGGLDGISMGNMGTIDITGGFRRHGSR